MMCRFCARLSRCCLEERKTHQPLEATDYGKHWVEIWSVRCVWEKNEGREAKEGRSILLRNREAQGNIHEVVTLAES